MKSPIATLLLVAIGSLCASAFLCSCQTLDEQSPHTKKVRKQDTHSQIMRRHHRRNRH